jgi:hypothetical protein
MKIRKIDYMIPEIGLAVIESCQKDMEWMMSQDQDDIEFREWMKARQKLYALLLNALDFHESQIAWSLKGNKDV